MKTTHTLIPDSVIELLVGPAEHGVRLDQFIAQRLAGYSRSFFQKLITKACVRVNNQIVHKHSLGVRADDVVAVHVPAVPKKGMLPPEVVESLGVQIVHAHKDFFIINKPAGLLVHPTSQEDNSLTLVDWIRAHVTDTELFGVPERPGIVHRLDKDTSGLMVVARRPQAQAVFGDLFKNREISKRYLAVVRGHPDKTATIDFPISRDTVVKNRMSHRNPDGRASLTHVEVKQYFSDTTLIEARPVTGRTHQIRVHCSALGHPLIGDVIYGIKSKDIKRQALHASYLAFEYNKKMFSFAVQPPDDFAQLIHKLS